MPLVSVVMPTYNQVRFLDEAVQSVLGQTMNDLELIVVNDGSTDHTAQVLAGITDPRLRVLDQANAGASAAMNAGFAQARGRYFTWLASDNAFHPRFLEATAARLDSEPNLGLAYTCFENVDESGEFLDYVFLEPWYPGLLLVNPGAVGVAFLYRGDLARAAGDYRDLVCNDLDFWLRLARLADFGFIPEVLAKNRKHGAMQTVVKRKALLREVEECLAAERARSDAQADPGLGSSLLELRRSGARLARVLQVRLAQLGEYRGIMVAGPRDEAAAVVAVLAGHGVAARVAGEPESVGQGEAVLALDQETETRLRHRGLPVLPLDRMAGPAVAMF